MCSGALWCKCLLWISKNSSAVMTPERRTRARLPLPVQSWGRCLWKLMMMMMIIIIIINSWLLLKQHYGSFFIGQHCFFRAYNTFGKILGYFSRVGSTWSESIGSRRVSTKLFGDLQRFEMILVAPNLLLPDLQRGQADSWLHPAAQSLDAHGRPARFLPPSRVQFQKPCPNLREVMIPMIHHGFRSISIVVHDDWMITRGTPMTKRKAPIENQCPVMKCTEVNNRLTCFERGLSQPSQNFCETCETTKQKSVDIPSFSGSPFWEELQLLSNCWSLHCHHQ